MAVDVTGIGTALSAVDDIIGKFFPDKTAIEKAQIQAAFSAYTAQTNIDQAEAASADPLQHWRGGLGWVCVAGYAYQFVIEPLAAAVAVAVGHPLALPTLDMGSLMSLTAGMLGLGALHVTGQINGVK
jgi:hypothetical protein